MQRSAQQRSSPRFRDPEDPRRRPPKRDRDLTCAAVILVLGLNASLALVLGALRYGLLPRTDPVLLPLALLAVGASPTAMNLSTIAQLAGSGQGEVTKVIFFQYIFAVITVSVYATLGLLLFGVGGP